MFYFKKIINDDTFLYRSPKAPQTTNKLIEITKEEYDELLKQMKEAEEAAAEQEVDK